MALKSIYFDISIIIMAALSANSCPWSVNCMQIYVITYIQNYMHTIFYSSFNAYLNMQKYFFFKIGTKFFYFHMYTGYGVGSYPILGAKNYLLFYNNNNKINEQFTYIQLNCYNKLLQNAATIIEFIILHATGYSYANYRE